MTTILLLALAGVVISVIVGSIWYSPSTPMGKIHMHAMGFDKLSTEEQKAQMEAAKPHMWKMYGAQMLLSLLTSLAVVIIVSLSIQNGLTFSMALGFVLFNWLAFMVPVVGSGVIWSNCEGSLAWKKFFSDSTCNLVTILLIALLTSLFV
jgi:hypothetical protein